MKILKARFLLDGDIIQDMRGQAYNVLYLRQLIDLRCNTPRDAFPVL